MRSFTEGFEKQAYETQTWNRRGGKIYSDFHGNRPATMTIARARGLNIQKDPGGLGYSASYEVKDPSELRRAEEFLTRSEQRKKKRKREKITSVAAKTGLAIGVPVGALAAAKYIKKRIR